MDHDKQLAFIANMTDKALQHVAATPNVMNPSGGMSHEKMLSFVTAMTKNGLQNFDTGGTALGGPSTSVSAPGAVTTSGIAGIASGPSQVFNPIPTQLANKLPSGLGSAVNTVQSTINPLGIVGAIQDSTQNHFSASGVPLQQGTNGTQLDQAYSGAQGALSNQVGLVGQTQGGINQGLNAQSVLSNQLANQAVGIGANPAQAQLNQATGQNIAQQAALAAGQRGAGANAGLIARQNAQQGAATQQGAIGQAATLSAQQQLAAQGAQAQLAATQVGQGATAIQNQNQQNQNEQNILQGSNTSLNNANVALQSNLNNVNAGVSEANQTASNGVLSGIAGGASSLLSALAKGGKVKKLADGGSAGDDTPAFQPTSSDTSSGPSVPATAPPPAPPPSSSGGSSGGGGGGSALGLLALLADGGKVAEHYHNYFRTGGKVIPHGKAEKATKPGDNYANDKVPALLSAGEVVIDRKTLADPGPMGQMARALARHLAKRNKQ